jgi:archaellum component FlaF (FlaF/FlaG flagellin family)
VLISCATKRSLLLFLSFGLATTSYGTPVPQNLGNGLNKILENSLLQAGTIQPPVPPAGGQITQAYVNAYKAAVLKQANAFDAKAIKEGVTGKYLVDIMPSGQVTVATLQTQLQAAFPALSVQHVDQNYAGHGVIEAYITLTNASGVATFDGVRSVILQLKPIHSVGAVTSQGINQHRVNRINKIYNPTITSQIDGTGMSIGVMSDSFDSQPSAEGGFTNATADVATGDLPGAANVNNSQPVVVLEDYNPIPGATNEGRGMCQIVADMAPKARIGFATADTGEVGFANNIRALGGLPGFTKPAAIQQGFKGDVVCDDVSYLDEPMFQDGIIAQGVIDVVNAGVSYCSSAANNWGTDGYDSVFRPVTGAAATAAATAAGLHLNTVPDPSLYAGGFHNFNPNPGQIDIAQLFNESSDPQAAVFQWSDPYDTAVPTLVNPPLYSTSGDSEPAPLGNPETTFTIPTPLTAGHAYVVTEHATPQDPSENFDAIVAIIDPNGNTILDQDTGVDETVVFFAQVSGTYKVRVHPFATTPPIIGQPAVSTRGHYSLVVNDTVGAVPRITQDFNLLFFDTNGNFLEAVASNNFANNRPFEIWVPDLSGSSDANGQVQMVIARANNTTPPSNMELKYVFFGNGLTGMGPAEYNNYLTPVTFGHSAAAGANSVAAYSMFRPNLPEDFTSPGPVTIYFDTNNNRLATPQVRLKPDIAAADGANNTFFPLGPIQDVPFDTDTQYPNFYGTSAASPHAASVAALVLQAHGGPRSLTPAEVKTIMQSTAFPHDLDPYFASGTAIAHNGVATVNVTSDNDSNTGTGSNDSNSWSVTYSGSGYVKEIHFNPNGMPGDGGNPTGGNYIGGAAPGTPTEYSDFLDPSKYNFTPGMVFNSNLYVNGSHSDVTGTATFSHQVQQGLAFNWTLNIAFPANSFIAGRTFRFNNGRNQQQDATVPVGQTIPNPLYGQTGEYSADILGSGVLIPEYADNPVILPGMLFTGIVTDGGVDYPFSGRIANKIGTGYSPLDGYGFINAQAAVAALPDLIVSTLTASNNQAPQGSKVTLTATIKNQGNANARASKTEFLLDGKTVIGLIDTPSLAPGASATVSVSWSTASVQKGQHTIKATADRNNAVAESTETNNTKSITVSIQGNKT